MKTFSVTLFHSCTIEAETEQQAYNAMLFLNDHNEFGCYHCMTPREIDGYNPKVKVAYAGFDIDCREE